MEDYLKAIYKLTAGQQRASTNQIAEEMDVAPASATGMIQKMARMVPPLVDYQKHQGVLLTPTGENAALEVIRHHRLLELYLHERLGYSWDQVHSEADRLPQAPGLVLGLMPGGACRGVAYRLPSPLAIAELHLLWRRDMVVGSYEPRWVTLDGGTRRLTGLAFVVKRDHPQFAGTLPLERQAEVIASACGHLGSSQDYLERTRIALASHGIVDPYLERITDAVRSRWTGK